MNAEVDGDSVHVDRILLPVTAAIYQNGMEKPAMKWSFEIEVGAISDKDLNRFIERLKRGFRFY